CLIAVNGRPSGELDDLQTRGRANEAGHKRGKRKGKDRNKGAKARNGEDMVKRWREMESMVKDHRVDTVKYLRYRLC
ncbi:hypothetical protein BDQ94DRAFT_155413, partial [Aspergillus welwitschiae]